MIIQICTKFSIMQTNVCRMLYPQILAVDEHLSRLDPAILSEQAQMEMSLGVLRIYK